MYYIHISGQYKAFADENPALQRSHFDEFQLRAVWVPKQRDPIWRTSPRIGRQIQSQVTDQRGSESTISQV